MVDYSKYSDDDLQRRAVSGDRMAEEQLALLYSRLVRICARSYFLAGGNSEDLAQEGMLGLLSAIREFDVAKSASFKTYAELCIRRRLLSAIKTASRLKHTPLNDGVSFDEVHSDESFTHAAFFDKAFRQSPEEQVLARESADELYHTFKQCLSKFEETILLLYLDGLSYDEMAKLVSRPRKSVDNAVQRIRRKLARHHNLGEFSNG